MTHASGGFLRLDKAQEKRAFGAHLLRANTFSNSPEAENGAVSLSSAPHNSAVEDPAACTLTVF